MPTMVKWLVLLCFLQEKLKRGFRHYGFQKNRLLGYPLFVLTIGPMVFFLMKSSHLMYSLMNLGYLSV